MPFIKNMSKRERYIALAAFLCVFLTAFYNFFLDPVLREWQALNSEIAIKTSALTNDLKMISERKSIEANYSKFEKYIKSGQGGEEESSAEVLSYLENLSRADSCLILNIKPLGTKDAGAYKEILIDLSSEGSISQFTKFLYDIENTKDMILKIRHFVLTSKAGQEGSLKGSLLVSKIIV